MSKPTIPDNNLPVYLQQYQVHILDAKDNESKAGSVKYTTVGAIPSNIKNERVWAFNLTGTLKPNKDKYHIVYDFSKVESAYRVKFKDFVSGTFTICGRVLDATKLIRDSYTYSLEDLTVIIELDTSRFDFRIKKETLFSFALNINDDTGIQILPNTNYGVTNDRNNNMLIQESSSVTIPNIVDPTDDTQPTFYSLSCSDSKVFLNYVDSSSIPTQVELKTGESIMVNSYNVLYTGLDSGIPPCSAQQKQIVGSIIFKLCDFPSTITPVKIKSGNSITISGGLNVYNYYTISESKDGQIINFNFILMNIKELDKPNSFLMIGKFWEEKNDPASVIVDKCPCDTLPESEVILQHQQGYPKYGLVNRNSMWYGDMKFGKYDYNGNNKGTIEKFNISNVGKFVVACQS